MPTIGVLLFGAVVVAVVLYFVLNRRSASGGRTASRAPARTAVVPQTGGKVNWLIGTGGEVEGKSYHVGHRTISIGREPANFVQVSNRNASRKHCQVAAQEGWLQVLDMGSENGTFVNGKPVTRGRMNPGDELRVGDAIFRYRLRAEGAQDEAMGWKAVGAAASEETIAAPGQGFDGMLVAALEASGGNVDEAARKLGVSPEVLQRLVEERGGKR